MSEVNDDKKTSSSIGKRNRRRGHNYECKIVKELKEITVGEYCILPKKLFYDLLRVMYNDQRSQF